MQYQTWIRISVMLAVMLLTTLLPLHAQESTPTQPKEESCPMCQKHMKNKSSGHDRNAERQQMHERMETMHQEMNQALQQQLTALRDHAKAMDGVSDQAQLLSEMKKHQQMSDTLLGTMIEHHHKMHTMMQEHHTHSHSAMAHEHHPTGRSTTAEHSDSQK